MKNRVNKSRNLFKANNRTETWSFNLHFNLSKKHFHPFSKKQLLILSLSGRSCKDTEAVVSSLPSISKSASELPRWRSARLISRQQKLQITQRKQHVGVDLLQLREQQPSTLNPSIKHWNPSTIQTGFMLFSFLVEEVFLPAAPSLNLPSLQLPVWGFFKLISLRLRRGSI